MGDIEHNSVQARHSFINVTSDSTMDFISIIHIKKKKKKYSYVFFFLEGERYFLSSFSGCSNHIKMFSLLTVNHFLFFFFLTDKEIKLPLVVV